MERGGLTELIGKENFFWSSDQAIVEAEKRRCNVSRFHVDVESKSRFPMMESGSLILNSLNLQ
jgi:hypothetical protein